MMLFINLDLIFSKLTQEPLPLRAPARRPSLRAA
jgi:hypothetical protein